LAAIFLVMALAALTVIVVGAVLLAGGAPSIGPER